MNKIKNKTKLVLLLLLFLFIFFLFIYFFFFLRNRNQMAIYGMNEMVMEQLLEWYIGSGNRSTQGKPTQSPFCLAQITHGSTQDQTRPQQWEAGVVDCFLNRYN